MCFCFVLGLFFKLDRSAAQGSSIPHTSVRRRLPEQLLLRTGVHSKHYISQKKKTKQEEHLCSFSMAFSPAVLECEYSCVRMFGIHGDAESPFNRCIICNINLGATHVAQIQNHKSRRPYMIHRSADSRAALQRRRKRYRPRWADVRLKGFIRRGAASCAPLRGATFLRFNDSVWWCPGCVGCLGLARLPDTSEQL